MANDNELKVDVKAFTETAEAITATIKTLEESMNAYFNGVNSLRNVWQGDGSNNIKAMANAMNTGCSLLLSNLQSYPKTLNEVAGIYVNTEKQLSDAGKSLQFDSSSMM